MSTASKGAVLKAGNKQANVVIRDSTFMNNSAVEGAVFHVEEESVLK
jgi:hypothetical protein